MSSLMITEYWCKKVQNADNGENAEDYTLLYALSNAFDYIGGIKSGDKVTCESPGRALELWEVVDTTRAIFKDPNVPSENAFLETVQQITGVIKTPDTTEDEADTEDSAAPTENQNNNE